MNNNELLEQYYEMFDELPPRDVVISYDDDFYQELLKKAISTKTKITPETLEKAIGDELYDFEEKEN